MGEWKPGDVAMVMPRGGDSLIGIRVPYGWEFGTGDLRDSDIEDVRPLVVIDPEDAGAIDRLLTTYHAQAGGRRDRSIRHMQAALRSLIEPPKPEEPTGLGAVVEAIYGNYFVRDNIGDYPWRRVVDGTDGEHCRWSDVNVVRVLSQGVTP